MRLRQDREYEQLLQNCQKEQNRVRNQLQVELDKRARENDEALRKFRKHKSAAQDHEFKCFVTCQKKEYKFNKERTKAVIFLSGIFLIKKF